MVNDRVRFLRLKFQRLFKRYPLALYRPRFRDRRFWIVQGLVILIAAGHFIHETGSFPGVLGTLYFIQTGLYLVPVVYAAINFGITGAFATALWATILSIPNLALNHQGLERFWEAFQIAIVFIMGILLGQRVDQERDARQHVEAARASLRASEIKYRSLFEASAIAILLLDAEGKVLEANPTACLLFNLTSEKLAKMNLADLVGKANASKLLNPSQRTRRQRSTLSIKLKDTPPVYLEPLLTQFRDSQGNWVTQMLLDDVTSAYHEQAGLRAFAAHVLHAQEEERQRIGHELHDEIIQRLILLCYRLDEITQRLVLLSQRLDGNAVSSTSLSSIVKPLGETRNSAEEIVRYLRDFVKSLRPPILDDLGVVASIRRLLVDLKERTGIAYQLKVEGTEKRLSADTELGIFRVAQEALRNVERHAQATRVAVNITFGERETCLELQDNGIGFNPESVQANSAANSRLGLIGMQERIKLMNGRLEIQSGPDKGTRVITSIPI